MQKVHVCIGVGYADVEYMQMLNIDPLLSFRERSEKGQNRIFRRRWRLSAQATTYGGYVSLSAYKIWGKDGSWLRQWRAFPRPDAVLGFRLLPYP